GDGLLGRDGGDGDGPLRADAALHRDLVDHGEQGVEDVTGAGEKREGVGDEGGDDRDVSRVLADDPGGDADEVVDAAGGLHRRGGHDHGDDDQEDLAGDAAGRRAEAEDEDGQTYVAPQTH